MFELTSVADSESLCSRFYDKVLNHDLFGENLVYVQIMKLRKVLKIFSLVKIQFLNS